MTAYVQNKVSVVDQVTLVRICKSAFSSDEIKNSKSLLFDSIPTEAHKINRKSKGKEERDLNDILNVFKKTEPDVIPVFVARQLERLPPILFNSLDCTKLLKDMLKLQNDLADIKETHATLEQLKGLKVDLLANKNDTLPPTPICNVNMRRGAAWNLDAMDSGPVGILQCNSTLKDSDSYRDLEFKSKNTHKNVWEVGAQKSMHGSVVEQRSSRDKSGNDALLAVHATTSSGVAKPKPSAVPERQLCDQMVNINNDRGLDERASHETSNDELPADDKEGKWIRVGSPKKQKQKYRFHGKYGVARDLECNFKAAERKVPVLITNVHRETTEDDVLKYIHSQTKDTVSLKQINIQKQREYKAYKMFVSKSKLHMYLDEKLWPEGIIFRRFVNYSNGRNSVTGPSAYKKVCNIASFNCKSIKRSIDGVRDLCRTCDVIALQELWLQNEELCFLSTVDNDFGFTGTSAMDTSAEILRGRPYGGVALLWRHSVFPDVSVIQCNNSRVCAIKITVKNNHIIVMSVYMPTNSLVNLPEFTDCLGTVSAIIDEYGVESVYILGDFNANPGELFFTELIGFCSEQDWSCIDTDKLGLSSGTYTFISEVYGTPSWLDHGILTQAAVNSVRHVRAKYDSFWSDHFPLIIECNLELLPPKLPNIIITNKNVVWGERTAQQTDLYRRGAHFRLRCIDFDENFISCADGYCDIVAHRRILDSLYERIVSALCEAAVCGRRGKTKRARGKHVMGWNKHVVGAHRMARERFLDWVSCGKPRSGIMFEEMCASRKVFKSRLKWCQNHEEQLKMDTLAEKHSKGNFRGFWRDTKKMNVRPGLPVSVDGVNDPKSIADAFKDHFRVQSPLGLGRTALDALTGTLVGRRFTAKSVAQAIKSISRGKSPGHDGLSIEHLQHAGPHIARVLAMFYNLCISHSYIPTDMLKTIVVPIVKNKTGDLTDKTNYRPISLATIVAKVFDCMLNTQLEKYLGLHDNQFGFRPHLSTDSAILCMKHTVRYYTDRQTPVYACFLDLSKAFDLVSYQVLWEKMEKINIPSDLINIFKYWYGHQVNRVRWAGATSEEYGLECGVRQGGLTSPALFNLYMDDLIGKLSSQHVGCHIDGVCVNNLSYADDMVLLSASMCGLRRLLKICEEYAASHGLKYNVTKSQYMVFEAGSNRPVDVPAVTLYGVPLERVDNFKYLGHIVTADLKDNIDIERERRALCVRANMLARRFARCSSDVKLTLFKAYCTSLYTCSLWANYTQKAYNALRVQYNNAFRAVMGLSRYCSASGMFAAARTACFHTTMRLRAASMVQRVRDSSNIVLTMIADRLDCPYIMQRHVKTGIG